MYLLPSVLTKCFHTLLISTLIFGIRQVRKYGLYFTYDKTETQNKPVTCRGHDSDLEIRSADPQLFPCVTWPMTYIHFSLSRVLMTVNFVSPFLKRGWTLFHLDETRPSEHPGQEFQTLTLHSCDSESQVLIQTNPNPWCQIYHGLSTCKEWGTQWVTCYISLTGVT